MFNYTDILIDINVLNKFYYIVISLEQSPNKHKIKYYELLDKLKIFNLDEKYINFDYEPKWVYCNFLIQNDYQDIKYETSIDEYECDIFLDKLKYEITTFQIHELTIFYGYAYHNDDINNVKDNYKLNTVFINKYFTLIEHSLYSESSIYFIKNKQPHSNKSINILDNNLYQYDSSFQIYDKKNDKRIVQTSDYKLFKNSTIGNNFFRKIKIRELFRKIKLSL